MSNKNLKNAKKAKNDEFYTQYVDIEKELQYYDFSGKSIYCNCDNPHYSNFYKYFKDNFQKLNITHLYCTGYNKDGNGYYAEYNGTEEILKPLNDNGDFRNEECINILKIADVIVTNPPFSLFRDYVKQLMDYNKKFLVIGNKNAITYKEIFPYIKNNELCLGNTIPNDYYLPNGEVTQRLKGLCRWFTNIPHITPNKPLILTKTYNPENYPHYDNYDAINVDKVKDIPMDYDGVMGVPITFLDKYCPSQFEIIGCCEPAIRLTTLKLNPKFKEYKSRQIIYNGNVCQKTYHRLLIKKNNSLEPIEFEIVDARDYTNIDKLKSKSTFLIKDKDSAINGKPTYARILIKKNNSLEPIEFEIVGQMANTNVDDYNFGYPFVFGK